MSTQLPPSNPLRQIEGIIIGVICVVLLLTTGGKLIYHELSEAPWPVQVGVGIAFIALIVWLYRSRNTHGEGS